MPRYIYADALLKVPNVRKVCEYDETGECITYKAVPVEAIEKAVGIDIVQCKDCKHLMFTDCYGECSKGHRGIVKPDDSCEFGEKFRREGRNE